MSQSDSDIEAQKYFKAKAIEKILKIKKPLFKYNLRPTKNAQLLAALQKRISLHPELLEQRLIRLVSVHHTEAVEKLLKSGVSANCADIHLRSPLHIAASRGYADIVELLLNYGANPNKTDIIKNTPLHLAACTSNLKIITLLVNGGADIRLLDSHGRNPIEIAESKLRILQTHWSEGAVEMAHVRNQLREVIDVMISMWKNKESTLWGHHRTNVDDLELMKLSINDSIQVPLSDQMNALLSELQQFTIK